MATTEAQSEDLTVGDRLGRWIRTLPPERKGALLVLPSAVYILVFLLLPLAIVLSYSFRVQESFQMTWKLTTDNFGTVLTSATFVDALWVSLYTSVIVTVISLLLGLPVAYYLAVHAHKRVRNFLIFLVIIPLLINLYVQAFSLIQVTGSRGVFNVALMELELIDEPIDWLIFSYRAVIMGLVYVWLPLMILPIYAVLRDLNVGLLQAARDLGAGPLRAQLEVTIPAAFPGIILGSFFVFLFTFGDLVISRMIGGGRIVTLSRAILVQLEEGLRWDLAAAGTVVMMLVIMVILIGVFRVIDMEEIFG